MHESVTEWLDAAQQHGDQLAQRRILERYWHRLSGLVRKRLAAVRTASFDEEDVVLDALHAFFEAAEAGRCPDMQDRNDLWNYLAKVAERKAIDKIRHEKRQKRGGGRVRGESALPRSPDGSIAFGMDNLPDLAAPTPEFAEEFSRCCYELLSVLSEREREIVLRRGQGFSVNEIARELDVSERTIERYLSSSRDKLRTSIDQ